MRVDREVELRQLTDKGDGGRGVDKDVGASLFEEGVLNFFVGGFSWRGMFEASPGGGSEISFCRGGERKRRISAYHVTLFILTT